CSTAVMETMRGASSTDWQNLLIQLVRAERLALKSPKFAVDRNCQPLPALSADWLKATDDESAEFRLAGSLANLLMGEGVDQRRMRDYWLPLEKGRIPRFRTSESSLAVGPDIVCNGNDLVADLVALLLRRANEVGRSGAHLGIAPCAGHYARLDDVGQFLSGAFDDRRCLELAMGFMAIHWSQGTKKYSKRSEMSVPASFALLKLALPLRERR